ncbi:MAG TPA: hypothetical protein VG075_04435 [Candidatus Acidoferrum sp.]|jgi:hypothetical protein|nr:hypothetical protein [Candidatus Acidoferrum sp.]
MATREELILTVIFPPLWPSDCEEPLDRNGDIRNYSNYKAIQDRFKTVPDPLFTTNYLYDIVMELRLSGELVKKTGVTGVIQPAVIDPRTSIPHRDKYPQITTLEQCVRFIKNAKGIPSGDLKAINELLAYLQQNNIREEAKAKEPELTPEQKANQNAYDEAVQLINNVSSKDVSLVKSDGRGVFGQIEVFKRQRLIYIRECLKRAVKGQVVLDRVRADIRELVNASPIR